MKSTAHNMIPELNEAFTHAQAHVDVDTMLHQFQQNSLMLAEETTNIYKKVDKTGVIGFVATYIEGAIDFGKSLFGSYGISIIVFTMIIKAVTLPLTTTQLESTAKMQQLTPLQKTIQEKYADDEQTKNQLLSQLFQAANVNPLAGCFPALVQIPIFISLYRALTNLVAEDKLGESFLWIPDLEGPIYDRSTAEAADWVKSIFSGNPILGWDDTLAFLSLPLILFVSQTLSQKILQPPKDPNRVMTEQEQMSQNIVNYLPFIVAFFSINVPAGLALYWIINNALTTLVTSVVKSSIQDEPFPEEVTRMMALVEGSGNSAASRRSAAASAQREMLRGSSASAVEDRPKVEGFGSQPLWNEDNSNAIDAEVVSTGSGESTSSSSSGDEIAEAGEAAVAGTTSAAETTATMAAAETTTTDGDGKKRKKRTKPSAKKSKKGKR